VGGGGYGPGTWGDLLLGGVIGLLVAVVTQLMARGGRSKWLRATIREELELVRLLDGSDDDPLKAKPRLQARVHIVEYLDDPELDLLVAKVRRMTFGPFWVCAFLSAAIRMVILDESISSR
jgi:hypothetical protein